MEKRAQSLSATVDRVCNANVSMLKARTKRRFAGGMFGMRMVIVTRILISDHKFVNELGPTGNETGYDYQSKRHDKQNNEIAKIANEIVEVYILCTGLLHFCNNEKGTSCFTKSRMTFQMFHKTRFPKELVPQICLL